MGWLGDILKKNSELESLFDLDLFTQESSNRAYLKKIALETCISFIGRTISLTDFRVLKDNVRQKDEWHYLLNVRPNTDQSAASFWQDFIYKLIYQNEVLVILTDTNDLLIADNFEREEYAVYADRFKDVTVKDYTFQRTFSMDEVIYVTFNNEKLTKYMDGMFNDYAELFGRVFDINLIKNQVRSTVGLEATQDLTDQNRQRLQEFLDKLFNSFRKNLVAIVPRLKGFDYKEEYKGEGTHYTAEELEKIKKSLINDVAEILGIPNALVHGELTEYETSITAFVKFCISPLLKKIQDELNAKLFEKKEYLSGNHIEAKFIPYSSIFDIAQSFDKLVASGGFTRNELRVEVGYDKSDNPVLDEFVLTKNYQAATETEGGETNT
ncbi:phage portal protein [Bacillus sp. RO2]|uniref:phage portal protein n=1 Tax=Bacillus sp. RO2 TaxID=2723913 RepID=UPI00145FBFAE|nr:phage portal protein [Bacillus sp. RO2]NMH72786.1 phage portal protein [Bacillus sp. RO2]